MTGELAAAPELKLSLRRSAMNALGRREQSVFELKQRLSQRYEDASEDFADDFAYDLLEDLGIEVIGLNREAGDRPE